MATIQSRRRDRIEARNQPRTLGKMLRNNARAIAIGLTGLAIIGTGAAVRSAALNIIDPMGRSEKGYVIAKDRESLRSALEDEDWTYSQVDKYLMNAEKPANGIFPIPQKGRDRLDRLGPTDRVAYKTEQEALAAMNTEYNQ
ncbi:hypothetical protein KAR91_57805 [Candidatus Pacearchaeota archaeon]|nr:hypothetical protein [Candidatus Pacearchaeota archaeon]